MSLEASGSEISWNLGDGRDEFLPRGFVGTLIPALIELDGVTPREFARRFEGRVRVPPLYTDVLPRLDARFEELKFVSCEVTEGFLEELAKGPGSDARVVRSVSLSPPLGPPAPLPKPTSPAGQIELPTGPPRPKTVVVAVIDDGIAFAHERFRETGGSRVEFFWMQDGPPPGPSEFFGDGGRELSKEAPGDAGIDSLLLDCANAGLVDEDELYRRARVVDPGEPVGHKAILWRRAHGTHVLDIAANYPIGPQPDCRIIAVQLPIASTSLPVDSTLAQYVYNALWYVLIRSLSVSQRLGCGPLPIVINLSYGLTTGQRDGTHKLEFAIDAALGLWRSLIGPAEMVIASGNNHLDRLHAVVRFPANQSQKDLLWRVQPDDQTTSVVEIWLPPSPQPKSARIRVSVLAPGGAGGTTPLGETPGGEERWEVGGKTVCRVLYAYVPPPTGRGKYLITLKPTAKLESDEAVAPYGLWTIRLTNLSLNPTEAVDLGVRRDEAPYGYPRRGRQSYFDDPAYMRYDEAGRPVEVDNASPVKRAGSINGLATGRVPSVVGGLLRDELRPAPYSAGGPITPNGGAPPHRDGPDALAVADESIGHPGILAAGSRSGSVVAMNGTSVAAPRVARWMAGELAAGRAGGRPAVKTLAQTEETKLPGRAPPPPPSTRGGWGRILLDPVSPRAAYQRRESD